MTPILDSRKLLAFTTLSRAGSFTLAARELHLTQSAVSHAIKGLEVELGIRLFNRLGRRVTLTDAGKQLLNHASKILAEMQVARADMAALVKQSRWDPECAGVADHYISGLNSPNQRAN